MRQSSISMDLVRGAGSPACGAEADSEQGYVSRKSGEQCAELPLVRSNHNVISMT